VVPERATNIGFIGQFAEVISPSPSSTPPERRGRQSRLLRRGPAPPPVYQGQYDPGALLAAIKVLL
jgi:oleate hydratase